MSQRRRSGPDPARRACHHLALTIVDERPGDYAGAWADLNDAMTNVAHVVTGYAHADYPSHEVLESARHLMHLMADEVVDAEAVRHPSPHRLIFRAPRYSDLVRAGGS